MCTLLSGEFSQRTGSTSTRMSSARASISTSTSKAKPSSVCRLKMARAASRRNALNPHCVSVMPGTLKVCTSALKIRPMLRRKALCGFSTRLRASARLPISTSVSGCC